MRGRLVRALGVTVLVFAGCFAVVLGALVFGEPGVPSLGGSRVAVVEVEGLIIDAERVVRELSDYGEDPSIRASPSWRPWDRSPRPGGTTSPRPRRASSRTPARSPGRSASSCSSPRLK